jgi:hypothetical protein
MEMTVATFVLIHGGGDVGWHWHLVEREERPDAPGHTPWPLDAWPPVPTRFVLCTEMAQPAQAFH